VSQSVGRSVSQSVGQLVRQPVSWSVSQSVSQLFIRSNILKSTLFLNILSLWFFLIIRYRVSHPHKVTGNIMALHILIFMFL